MGSKATMLQGELGRMLIAEAAVATRFVDLFAGSGSVSTYVAKRVAIPTVSVDLLGFSSVLSGAVTRREKPVLADPLWSAWRLRATELASRNPAVLARASELSRSLTESKIRKARVWCAKQAFGQDFILRDYGGHYFSPEQAFWLSCFQQTLPRRSPERAVALSSIIRVASRCSASPGHTAQPFQPSERLLPHIVISWNLGVLSELEKALGAVAPDHALRRGTTVVGDALAYCEENLRAGDLLFCDPPYSEAQYSRFYHVLEGIFQGGWPSVSGAGRAPAGSLRPTSSFSGKTSARAALSVLLTAASLKGCTVVLTYPEGMRSNGLSVEDIDELAEPLFTVEKTRVAMSHSTLGGSPSASGNRGGRRQLFEIVFVLRSKP